MATPQPKKTHDLKSIAEYLRSLLGEGRTDEAVEVMISMLLQLQEKNAELALQILKMQRERVGRRSESMDPHQISLMLEKIAAEMSEEADLAATQAEEKAFEAERAAIATEEVIRRVARRRKPSQELPRKVIHHELPPEERLCTGCGQAMPEIGTDVSEVVELIPAQFLVEEHRRTKYACPRCKETVRTARGPEKAIEKGLPGPGLLAHLAVSKYEQHLPLTRLVEIYRRGGLETSTSTMCGWVAAVARDVEPIVERIAEKCLASVELQTDGSGLKVLDRDDPQSMRRGTMWCCVGERKYVLFRYAKDGSGEQGPWRFLAGRKGYVQADAASVFDRLYNGRKAEATEVGCLAHARRKYYDLVDTDLRAAYPIKLIGQLYQIEDLADRRKLAAEERQVLRETRSAPIMDRYQRWLLHTISREPPASAMAKACAYSLRNWEALTRFLKDGILPLDNNLCEQQIRSLALGRRNYLFAGSDAGAHRAAILYSLIRTCALHGIDAFAYLADVLRKLASGWPQNRLDELLPESWSPAESRVTPDITEVAYNNGEFECRRELAWPMKLIEEATSPVVQDVDGDGCLELLIGDESGWIHVLELPGVSVVECPGEGGVEWAMASSDAARTGVYSGGLSLREDSPADGAAFSVGAPSPNPFNPTIRFRYQLPCAAPIRVSVFDVSGREMVVLASGTKSAGAYDVIWDGRDSEGRIVASGTYFVRLRLGSYESTQKITLMK